MSIELLKEPLTGDDIEFRVSRKVQGGSYLLAYKNARVDMHRLDDAVGPENWQRLHPNGSASCRVGIRVDGEWIWKEDFGSAGTIEPVKSEASDSFKRACTNWSIGRELYDYPSIFVPHGDGEKIYPQSWKSYIEHDDDGLPSFIALQDNKGNLRFKWGERKA